MSGVNRETYNAVIQSLRYYTQHPDEAPAWLELEANRLLKDISTYKEISCHSAWGIKTIIKKYKDMQSPETVKVVGNIITNGGANEMLKLIFGVPGTKPFNYANTRIMVGSDDTAEAVTQTGLVATAPNIASAQLASGYPQITGRSVVLAASFGANEANFPWKEISVVNGTGADAIALNRQVDASIGTKSGDVWTVETTISVVEITT